MLNELKLEEFTGFYEIEKKLKAVGIDRSLAVVLFTYFKANHQYSNIIKKMDCEGSPMECRTYDINGV